MSTKKWLLTCLAGAYGSTRDEGREGCSRHCWSKGKLTHIYAMECKWFFDLILTLKPFKFLQFKLVYAFFFIIYRASKDIPDLQDFMDLKYIIHIIALLFMLLLEGHC